MLHLLSLLSLFVITLSEEDDHAGHQHADEHIADCECTTGITTEMLDLNCDDSDFASNLEGLESYLKENDCSQYCMDLSYVGSTDNPKAAFRCYQVFSVLVQYHDYCSSGTVNEELFHDYLEVCPDCYQNHFQYPGADPCDSSLNCTDSEHQIEDVQFVLDHCLTACPDDVETLHDGEIEHESCTEIWQHVEGYHRACAHTDLTEEFDELYDQAAFSNTVCDNIHCNVPWEINGTANCTAEPNHDYYELRELYGDLVIADIVGESQAQAIIIMTTMIITIIATIFV